MIDRPSDRPLPNSTIDLRDLAVPTVHLNGSHGPTLVSDLQTAYVAVDAAIDALARAMPHGRDYYVQPSPHHALAQATREHCARVAVLARVRRELTTIAIAIQDQR